MQKKLSLVALSSISLLLCTPVVAQNSANKNTNSPASMSSQNTDTIAPLTVSDPLEPINRPIFHFNEAADKYVLKPVAKTYDTYTPSLIKTGIGNFFQNLKEPANIINYALQRNGEDFSNSAGRFLTNTTFGLGGLFDVAYEANMRANNTSFGTTLGSYSVPAGPYVVLPILGPSNARNAASLFLVDYTLKPQTHLHGSDEVITVGVEAIDTRAQYLKAGEVLERAIIGDKYEFIRTTALQKVQNDDEKAVEKSQ